MFDWVPLRDYNYWYYQIVMIMAIIVFLHSLKFDIKSKTNQMIFQVFGSILFLFVLLYMGTRPVTGTVFIDMGTYNQIFQGYARGGPINSSKDWLFHQFMWSSAQVMNNRTFFFVCAVIYVVPCYLISKKWFGKYWFYSFLLLIGSFSFWTYGVNGIRNGMGTSLFLMALASDKRWQQLVWLFLAVNIHSSMMLPSLGLVITWFYNQPKAFYYFWLACIPLSLAFPGFWENFFASMVEDDRSRYLTSETYDEAITQTGFRWDFLLYSATGVFAGTYYLFKKKIEDQTYIALFNVFLFANAFWILVIRANFSNRFAYLSWFLLALVIGYPWVKYYFEKDQYRKLGYIMVAYVGFTYFMGVILKMN